MRFSKALTLISVVAAAVAAPSAHDHPYENGGSTGVSTGNGGSTGSTGSTGDGGAAPQQPATALCEESLGALNCCQSQQKMETESLLPALTNSLGSLGGLLDILVQLLLPVVLPVGLSCTTVLDNCQSSAICCVNSGIPQNSAGQALQLLSNININLCDPIGL